MTYLLDKSAWEQVAYSQPAEDRVTDLIRSASLAVCTPTVLEILYSARNHDAYERQYASLSRLTWVDLSDPRQAVELQRVLAARGWHRTPIEDVVIAATAAEHSCTVLHYDRDYERLAETGGFAHEWIIPAGTGHRRDGNAGRPADR